MGLELIAMGVGAAAKAYAANQAAKSANGAAASGIAQQAADRAKANALVTGNINSLAASNPEAYRAANAASFMDTLRANQPRISMTTPPVNGADARYQKLVANAQAAATAHTNANAGYIASLMAAQQQRQKEGQNMADTATGIGGIQQNSAQDEALTRMRVAAASQPNPWLTLGGSLLENVGSSGVLGPKPMLSTGYTPGATGMNDGASLFQTMPAGRSGPQ